jgi:bifunctional UDP-N-acetylglucosamine pyrophosphorylase/glucosamine-1-phosphate N-acetyltransferase
MKSERVKVLHEICGRPMLSYVIDACRAAGVSEIVLVVGHDKERVIALYRDEPGIKFVTQTEQKGTGHACLVCRDAFAEANLLESSAGDTLVLCGDGPLIRAETLKTLLATHRDTGAAVTLATCNLPDPAGYGRIVRDGAGNVRGIVEQNDATPEQIAITEVNPSYYVFKTADLFSLLAQVKPNNKKGEYYLTDTLGLALAAGGKVAAVPAVPPEDVLSINTRADLAAVNAVMQTRIQRAVLASGVTIVSPERTWIEHGATIGADAILEPFTFIAAGGSVAPGQRVLAGSIVRPDGESVARASRP